MREGPRSIYRIAQPIKNLAQRFAFLGLLVAAVGMTFLGKVDVLLMDSLRSQVTDAVAPILDALSKPIQSVSRAVDQISELSDLRQENLRLRLNEARLLQWQGVARRLESENKGLKGLLNYVPEPLPSFITARVIADTGGAFFHSLILNAGSQDGVTKGQAAITGDGLVGRIAGVGFRSSRILLITDLNSRIPVLAGRNRTRVILAGNNSDKPRLIHLPSGETVSVGDRVVTSGHGGAFPPGLPVGIVSAVEESVIQVTPFVERNRLEYIRLLDFGLGGILPLPQLTPRKDAGQGKGARARKP